MMTNAGDPAMTATPTSSQRAAPVAPNPDPTNQGVLGIDTWSLGLGKEKGSTDATVASVLSGFPSPLASGGKLPNAADPIVGASGRTVTTIRGPPTKPDGNTSGGLAGLSSTGLAFNSIALLNQLTGPLPVPGGDGAVEQDIVAQVMQGIENPGANVGNTVAHTDTALFEALTRADGTLGTGGGGVGGKASYAFRERAASETRRGSRGKNTDKKSSGGAHDDDNGDALKDGEGDSDDGSGDLEGGPDKPTAIGRPIAYTGDPSSPHLTDEERRRLKRRIANRESARRVRLKRQELMEELQQKCTVRMHEYIYIHTCGPIACMQSRIYLSIYLPY